jgi:LPS-assembly lipoprotein
MSSSDRRAFLTLALVALAGCGFSPALAPGSAADGVRGQIDVATPSDITGFELVRALESRLGPSEAPRYLLTADIRLRDEGVGIQPDQSIPRYNLQGIADYTLTDLATGATVTSGQVANFTSYLATSGTVAITSAQLDARRRLMAILADQIVDELLLSRPDWPA